MKLLEALLNLLVRSNLDIPKKSRPSASFRTRIARFVRAVRPIRTGAYMSAFLIIYLLTRSPFYLIAALAEALLLCAHLIANRKLNHSSFS